MNSPRNIPDGGRSDRANEAVTSATSHLPEGRIQPPFYGQGMHQGNTVPTHGATRHDPVMGATPPTQYNPTNQPGKGANPIIRKVRP